MPACAKAPAAVSNFNSFSGEDPQTHAFPGYGKGRGDVEVGEGWRREALHQIKIYHYTTALKYSNGGCNHVFCQR